MVHVLGHTADQGIIYRKDEEETFNITTFSRSHTTWSFSLGSRNAQIHQISVHLLNPEGKCDEKISKPSPSFYLISTVCQDVSTKTWSTGISVLKMPKNNVVGKLELVTKAENELRVHFLPNASKTKSHDYDKDRDESASSSSSRIKLLVLTLEESIILYELETTIFDSYAKIEIVSSESVAKAFYWAQWIAQQEAVAFAHWRKPRVSSYDDEELGLQPPKPFLSVLQFHKDYSTESVLNMPLELEVKSELKNGFELSHDPNILKSTTAQLKLLAHPSGAVYLFKILSTTTNCLTYSLQLLHHNKTLDVKVKLENSEDFKLDVGLYAKDQYLIVAGWPHFIHFLDVGSIHEPSHHLIFRWDDLFPNSNIPFLGIFNGPERNKSLTSSEKSDLSSKPATHFVYENLSCDPIDLNSSLLLPLLKKRKGDISFKLAVLHHFLIHAGDINVSKRIIYDEGKERGNLLLKHLFQEFLIAHAHLQTRKQLLPNMDSFLYLLPYSADPERNEGQTTPELTLGLSPKAREDVSIMLLSPSQRVFPHNVTDLWTSLFNINRNYSRSKRFSHKEVAEKLSLSLQCYKPEALSRASTPGPMSPSSPMICTSLGDIVGMFGRRATELQLPFVEHESCTANKQEYIFSINLRELSMHLLKERKEWPLHGHTVAGKYVCALGDTARLLCHLLCLTAHLQPTRMRDKGFNLIDSLEWEIRLKVFMLMEHYALALTTLACPLPQGFTPFFAYLGYRVFNFEQFLWHVRSGSFELQIDLVKTIMTDLGDEEQSNVCKKMQLLSLLPKTRANRILNTWGHKVSVVLRARQHASDLLSGSVAQGRKQRMNYDNKKKKEEGLNPDSSSSSSLDTFFQLLTAKANASDIDLGLLTEATLISMQEENLNK